MRLTPTIPLIRRADYLADGFSDNDIRRERELGTLTALTPGVYLRRLDAEDLDPRTQHRAAVEALLPRLSGDPVVSHQSAAILHHLLDLASGAKQPLVHITRPEPAKSRRGARVYTHRGTLAADEVVIVAGLPVTTVVRTVLDCALELSPDDAQALIANALAGGRVSPAELTTHLSRLSRRPGVRSTAAVIAAAVG